MRWLRGHTKDVRAVVFAPDGRLVSGGSDKRVCIWDPLPGTILDTLRSPNVVYALAISPDGKTLAFAGRHLNPLSLVNVVHLYDLAQGEYAREIFWRMVDFPRSIWSLSYSSDGKYLAAACRARGR